MGGDQLWEEADDAHMITDILEPNELYACQAIQTGDTVYVEIDTNKTRLENMYKWSEVPDTDKEILCWRTFYYIDGGSNAATVYAQLSQSMRNVLCAILKTNGVE